MPDPRGRPDLDDAFDRAPLMAILRAVGVERATAMATTAWDVGIDLVEVTLQGATDVDALRSVVTLARDRDRTVGAGTIVDPAQVPVAVDAGAAFLVSPGLDPALVDAARAHGVPLLPGVATPTEVQRASSLGLTWLKAFPAAWLGTEWFRAMHGPFPDVRFVATGGVDADNVADFLAAGARAAAVGSALDDPAQLDRLGELLRTWRAPG